MTRQKPIGSESAETVAQSTKFKALACEVEADEDEQKFDDTLRRLGYHNTADKERKDEGQ